jgi:hypothetical protein
MAEDTLKAKRLKAARNAYGQARKTTKPGEGSRFKAVEASAKAGGASDPGAVAAAVGRKKYGKKKFQAMATKGKKG